MNPYDCHHDNLDPDHAGSVSGCGTPHCPGATEDLCLDCGTRLIACPCGCSNEWIPPEYNKVRLDILYADDWAGLYANGELVHEDHCITCEDLLAHIPPGSSVTGDVDWPDGLDEYLSEHGRLLPELSDQLAALL